MSSAETLIAFLKEENIAMVDLRFTDTIGKEQHVTLPADQISTSFFKEGKAFDGSSIRGWKGISESDMLLMPDPDSAVVDPYCDQATVNLRCSVVEPATMMGYERDPRSIAQRAEAYLCSTGIADTCNVGPEPEFFVFDDVSWSVDMSGAGYQVSSSEAVWQSNTPLEQGNKGHRPGVKGGYFPVPPVDGTYGLRAEMCRVLALMGQVVEAHHHEVATAGQNEIATRFNSLTLKADELQVLKYVIHNTAHLQGKTATFMPKPVVGDNGSGMHVHQSLFKNGENIFAGEGYAGLSDEALFYIGGIIKHAKAINAFANASTNSYKRLVPGFEAPVLLAYSARNRSASIRIPYTPAPKARRIEVRFPDPTANPYLAFSAMLMAGLDGIQNHIHPGEAMDKDLYDLPPEALENVPTVAGSLEEALHALDEDRQFLKMGDVFSDDVIDAYIALKMEDVEALNLTTHPLEFKLYYSV